MSDRRDTGERTGNDHPRRADLYSPMPTQAKQRNHEAAVSCVGRASV